VDHTGPVDGLARMAENRGWAQTLQKPMQHHGGCHDRVPQDDLCVGDKSEDNVV